MSDDKFADKNTKSLKTYKELLFNTNYPSKEILQNALERAWQTRNFEIELYWKRALYFWGFISVIFGAYLASMQGSKFLLATLLSFSGIVFSYAFLLVNKGSKFWQENWESHIDMLEDEYEGRLYKTILFQNKKRDFFSSSSQSYSVSNINLYLSFYLLFFWGLIFFGTLYMFGNEVLEFRHQWLSMFGFYIALFIFIFFLVIFLFYFFTSFLRTSHINTGYDASLLKENIRHLNCHMREIDLSINIIDKDTSDSST